MTDVISEALAAYHNQDQKKTRLRLELLEQHGVTTLWSSLMTAVESASDRWGLADIARRIRAKELYCLAIWKDDKISGSLVLQPTTI